MTVKELVAKLQTVKNQNENVLVLTDERDPIARSVLRVRRQYGATVIRVRAFNK